MYASWRSAHFAESSVETDWFCPSGSSVTRYVDPFERASTSVCTLRFPYFVGRAVDIFAASSLAASALGFSITRFACGSRNSIFATSERSSRRRRDAGILPGRRLTKRQSDLHSIASSVVEAKHDVLIVGA